MKKIFLFAAVALFSMGSMIAQNTFKGVVNYEVTSTGKVPYQLPDQVKTATITVMDDKATTTSPILLGSPMVSQILVEGRTSYSCLDLSMILMYLQQNDVEISYTGAGKLLTSSTITQNELDSLTIPVTEGFYIEYVDGETKSIAGYTAKKAVVHVFGEDGDDHQTIVWYTDEIGPEVNPMFTYVRGMALQTSMDLGEGREITLTATEVKKGKVSKAEMLLPSGFEEISSEDFQKLWGEISEELKYLSEE